MSKAASAAVSEQMDYTSLVRLKNEKTVTAELVRTLDRHGNLYRVAVPLCYA